MSVTLAAPPRPTLTMKTATDMKPASRRICRAVPKGDKFVAEYAMPGLVPEYVQVGGAVKKFETAEAAEIAALKAFASLYDSRTLDTRKNKGYVRMTGAELALALDELNVTPTFFAELTGFPQSRVMGWIDGVQDIPHSVYLVIHLMRFNPEKMIDRAEDLLDRVEDATSRPGRT
ncbi:hypothetical protein [Shinella sp. JR1-6]|uniref:hypothetical protein n=1 Tax=Shinella sp. JR1-6 TaxID=2527671 RepID=UPI00102D66D8|nr:hypothetical protein [Shinella sp. JR1-6]TAA54581.1 hypothetical protein EXZ48_26510 [Shinella sp. JR1-6]